MLMTKLSHQFHFYVSTYFEGGGETQYLGTY